MTAPTLREVAEALVREDRSTCPLCLAHETGTLSLPPNPEADRVYPKVHDADCPIGMARLALSAPAPTAPDIVDELREWARDGEYPERDQLELRAAAEIERLRGGVRGLALDADARGFDALSGSLLLWLDTPGQSITFGPV